MDTYIHTCIITAILLPHSQSVQLSIFQPLGLLPGISLTHIARDLVFIAYLPYPRIHFPSASILLHKPLARQPGLSDIGLLPLGANVELFEKS